MCENFEFFDILETLTNSLNNFNRKTIVFIHGMWSTGDVSMRLREVLENWDFDFHAPTLPEHAQDFCEATLRQQSIADYTAAIHDYIDQNQLDSRSLVLIGHSMGGLIAQLVAAEREVDSLVLLNSAAPYGVNHIYPKPFWSALHIFAQPGFWKTINRPSLKRACLGLFNQLDEKTALACYDSLVHDSGRSFAEIVFWWLDPNKTTKISGAVSGRKLIVCGGQDRIIKPIVGEQLRNKYPEADFRLFPSNGHWLFGEPNDELIFQGVADWLKVPTVAHHTQPIRPVKPVIQQQAEPATKSNPS